MKIKIQPLSIIITKWFAYVCVVLMKGLSRHRLLAFYYAVFSVVFCIRRPDDPVATSAAGYFSVRSRAVREDSIKLIYFLLIYI